jgi:symplekin
VDGLRRRASLTTLAIGICFRLTTIFRSDILGVALQAISESPHIPVLFLRTVIQAVSTYKSLVPFVSNNVLPKLIQKKIWTNPQLWDGFVRCVKLLAPASFGACLQLGKEQLRDLVTRQPGLRGGLKAFLETKPGTKAVVDEVSVGVERWDGC